MSMALFSIRALVSSIPDKLITGSSSFDSDSYSDSVSESSSDLLGGTTVTSFVGSPLFNGSLLDASLLNASLLGGTTSNALISVESLMEAISTRGCVSCLSPVFRLDVWCLRIL